MIRVYCTCVAISRLSQNTVGRENTVQVPRTFSHLTMFRQSENESEWLKSDELLNLTCDHPVCQMHDVFFRCLCVCLCACACVLYTVELPSDDDSMEAGPSTRVWKHCRPETCWGDAAHLPLHGSSNQGGKWQSHYDDGKHFACTVSSMSAELTETESLIDFILPRTQCSLWLWPTLYLDSSMLM